MPYYYGAFDLIIESGIELFGLETIDSGDLRLSRGPDVSIRLGKVTENLEFAHAKKSYVQIGPSEVLITHPLRARFLIQHGERVVIEPLGLSLHQVAMGVTGSCLGAVLQQRMKLTFHGGAVKMEDRGVVLFLGRKGAGKSTISALLGRYGYDVLADDICAVEKTDEGCALLPGIPSIKLCSRTIDTLGYDSTGLRMVKTHCDKYLVPIKPMVSKGLPVIERIYILGWADRMEIVSVNRKQAVPLLSKSTYRKWMIRQIMGESGVFSVCSHIAQSVPVYTFLRPKNLLCMEESLECVMKHIEV